MDEIMHRDCLNRSCVVLSLCFALLFFSPVSHATSCPVGAPATCLTGQGDWTSTLSARSFDGGTTIGGYFDSALNITWLADANYSRTSGYDSDGLMTWSAANGWASTLTLGGVAAGTWRLMTMTDIGNDGCNNAYTGTDCGYNVQTGTSEMAHMFYVTLGDTANCNTSGTCNQPNSGLSNTGPFANLRNFPYWTNLAYAPSPGSLAWNFTPEVGNQNSNGQGADNYAWAVHAGDVGSELAAVPIPAAMWLFGSGLLGLAAAARKLRMPNSVLAPT